VGGRGQGVWRGEEMVWGEMGEGWGRERRVGKGKAGGKRVWVGGDGDVEV